MTTETFRAAAVRAIAARTMPVLSDRLVVRASTFGYDDVLVGAAARILDQELGHPMTSEICTPRAGGPGRVRQDRAYSTTPRSIKENEREQNTNRAGGWRCWPPPA